MPPIENLLGIIGLGAFGFLFLGGIILGLIELLGKIYGTFRCLVRKDLSGEQRLIYLLLIWFIPFGWVIYFLLGTERTANLFSRVDIF